MKTVTQVTDNCLQPHTSTTIASLRHKKYHSLEINRMTNTWSSATGFCCIEPERKNWCGKTAYPVHQDSTCLPFRFFDHETIVLNRKEQLLFICRSKDICLPRYSANPIWTGMAISESRLTETTNDNTWCSIAHVSRKRNCPENRVIENFKSGYWHPSRSTDTCSLKVQTNEWPLRQNGCKNWNCVTPAGTPLYQGLFLLTRSVSGFRKYFI